MADGRHNMKNPAVKRILQEVKEMQSNPSDDYMSLPVEDNIFEWQFAIRGPKDSEFEGGIYHGRIQLPPEYPFKPPSFMLLTPNGRFETQTKICLSISQYHPEHWQPSWSVRTALVALIAFMPTKPDGAIGSLDYTKEERRALAIKSRGEAPKFGSEERQKLIDEIQRYMVQRSPPVPDLPVGTVNTSLDSACEDNVQTSERSRNAEELAAAAAAYVQQLESDLIMHGDVGETVQNTSGMRVNVDADNIHGSAVNSMMGVDGNKSVQNTRGVHVKANVGHVAVDRISYQATDVASASTIAPLHGQTANSPSLARAVIRPQQPDDHGLTLLAIGLTMALVALLVKRFIKAYWWFDAGSI